MENLYKIKPLDWKKLSFEYEWYNVNTVFGNINIEHKDNGWSWRYCFDEYYDEDEFYCNTKEECFENAEKFYLKRLMDALELVE